MLSSRRMYLEPGMRLSRENAHSCSNIGRGVIMLRDVEQAGEAAQSQVQTAAACHQGTASAAIEEGYA